jgi:hypothetical protein
MEVYKFAHEMQITSLMHAVNEFFKTIRTSSELLAVFAFCIDMDNNQGLQNCQEVNGYKISGCHGFFCLG